MTQEELLVVSDDNYRLLNDGANAWSSTSAGDRRIRHSNPIANTTTPAPRARRVSIPQHGALDPPTRCAASFVIWRSYQPIAKPVAYIT